MIVVLVSFRIPGKLLLEFLERYVCHLLTSLFYFFTQSWAHAFVVPYFSINYDN